MTAQTQSKNITLYFREGSSDKVYQASLQPKGAGFVVNFAFGRRGTTLQTGTKTAKPVDYQAAAKVYDKLVRRRWPRATRRAKTAPRTRERTGKLSPRASSLSSQPHRRGSGRATDQG